MIESISISKVATYPDTSQVMDKLSQFNFIFGSNGSGKTTITRIINNEENYPSCTVNWKDGVPVRTVVYNSDFIQNNFSEGKEFRGIFTLGEEQIETLNNISEIKFCIDKLTSEINSLTETLSQKKNELQNREKQLIDRCWIQKKNYDNTLKNGFERYNNSKKNFKDKVLEEWKTNQAELCDFRDLESRASSVFIKKLEIENNIPTINLSFLVNHESNIILAKRVIGKEDIDIAEMIRKLGNSDWIRQGKEYFRANSNRICPFCQQHTDESFSKSLEEYFDETFTTNIKEIECLNNKYIIDSQEIKKKLNDIPSSRLLDADRLTRVKKLLDSKVKVNQQLLKQKKAEPSQPIELESLQEVANEITELINDSNAEINKHNHIVKNVKKERRILTDQIWKFIIEQLSNDLKIYEKQKNNLKQAIDCLNSKINEKKKQKNLKSDELKELEKKRTSIKPTINAINKLLMSFGFTSFSLAQASESSYKLIRANGKDAKSTLSEGEKNFLTFLYFYHLLKGSTSESEIMIDRVVVIDDPISSLDSEILFIVSTLIRKLFEEIQNKANPIKQIFILTHNIYFHKEVTFNLNRIINDKAFWVIRKFDKEPKLEFHKFNPIKTSYELLWSEVRRSDPSTLTIQNTLRRILESYFKILGGLDTDKICSLFAGSDYFVCKSLFSWLNDGSHWAHDDMDFVNCSDTVEQNLRVFKEIFERSGHIAHYNMMMGETAE